MRQGQVQSNELHHDVRQVVAKSGSTFVNGMRILSPHRRDAIHAVYAFCRVVDDIVDGGHSVEQKHLRLHTWEQEINAVFSGNPSTPIGLELAKAAERYDLPEEEFRLILEGMWMDVTPLVAPDWERLEAYIRRVAGAVGLLCMRIFGAWRGAPSHRFALALAEAMQLTNILRDVEEDAAIGRVYLPKEVLDAAGVPGSPALIASAANLPQARRAVGARARNAFRMACSEVPAHGRLRLAPALLMMGPYERLLAQMEADWERPPLARPGWRKAWDGARCVALGGHVR
jgi:presqualene diphosphate synthase